MVEREGEGKVVGDRVERVDGGDSVRGEREEVMVDG